MHFMHGLFFMAKSWKRVFSLSCNFVVVISESKDSLHLIKPLLMEVAKYNKDSKIQIFF